MVHESSLTCTKRQIMKADFGLYSEGGDLLRSAGGRGQEEGGQAVDDTIQPTTPDREASGGHSPVTLSQILAGFDPPPGPTVSEEETRRYWDAYDEKRRNFSDNRFRCLEDKWEQYAGKTLVWSPDGTQILAVGSDPLSLSKQIDAPGVESSLLVIETVPEDPYEVFG
jgi:hypothetical protein